MPRKKPKAVMVDGVPKSRSAQRNTTAPISRIRKKHEKLRKRYREVHGKKVDWISHLIEEGISFSP